MRTVAANVQSPDIANGEHNGEHKSTGKSAIGNKRPETIAQRRLVEKINHSPRVFHQQSLAAGTNNSPRMIVQRVFYKGMPYPKNKKADFLAVANSDLEGIGFPMNPGASAALSAIAEHDETAAISDVRALAQIITLSGDARDDETGIHRELGQVTAATDIIGRETDESIVAVEILSAGTVSSVHANMDAVTRQLDAIEAIPVQDRSLDEQKGNALFVKQTFKISPAPAPDPKVPVLSKLGKIKKWAGALAVNLFKQAVRWHALGSLGAQSADGRRHLNIGPKTQTGAIATGNTPEKHGTLWASPWSPGVNAEWIKAGVTKELDFHLTTPPTVEIARTLISGNASDFVAAARADADKHIAKPVDSIYWNRDKGALTRLGAEIHGLLAAGYRLVEE